MQLATRLSTFENTKTTQLFGTAYSNLRLIRKSFSLSTCWLTISFYKSPHVVRPLFHTPLTSFRTPEGRHPWSKTPWWRPIFMRNSNRPNITFFIFFICPAVITACDFEWKVWWCYDRASLKAASLFRWRMLLLRKYWIIRSITQRSLRRTATVEIWVSIYGQYIDVLGGARHNATATCWQVSITDSELSRDCNS